MAFSIETAPVYGVEIGEDGPYTVRRVVVTATSPRGEVFGHFHLHDDIVAAERLADRVRAAGPDWSPVDSEHWTFMRHVYGSDSWGREDEHAQQRLDVEGEFGPDAYRPGGPGYLS